ncbi:MAG: hypothetical protein ABEK50_16850 [bacterium]
MAQHTPYCRTDRWIMICTVAAVIFIGAAFFHPLWYTKMSAPQYPGEDLIVSVFPTGKMDGDLQEIKTLNQYIGVHMPTDIPELQFVPWVLGVTVFMLVMSLWIHPGKLRQYLLGGSTGLMVLLFFGGLGMLQYRLYVMGHNRDPNPPLVGFEDFTPPALGSINVGNFDALMLPGLGGWLLALAFVLTLTSLIIEWQFHSIPELTMADKLQQSDSPGQEPMKSNGAGSNESEPSPEAVDTADDSGGTES